MITVKWIKLSTDLFNDEKIRYIEQLPEADSILVIWIKLLVLAGAKNSGGEVYFNDELPYTDEMLSAIWHRKVNTIRLALETFCKLRMIEISKDRTIIICNWGKHQNLDRLEKLKQDAADRQKRFRQRHRQERPTLVDSSRDSNVTGRDALRYASRSNCVTVSAQIENKREKEEEEPSAVSLAGRPPADGVLIVDPEEAKRLICEKILGGKDPRRPWSYDAQERLEKLTRSPGLPLHEIERIAWFRSLPKTDEIPELRNRRDPVTETGLMGYWGDEFVRAEAYWQKKYARAPKKKDPPNWREFFRWQYDPDVRLPDSFEELGVDQQAEYERCYDTFCRATAAESAA